MVREKRNTAMAELICERVWKHSVVRVLLEKVDEECGGLAAATRREELGQAQVAKSTLHLGRLLLEQAPDIMRVELAHKEQRLGSSGCKLTAKGPSVSVAMHPNFLESFVSVDHIWPQPFVGSNILGY